MRDRKVGQVLEDALDLLSQRKGRDAGADDERQREETIVEGHDGVAHLRKGNEHFRLGIVVEAGVAFIGRHADDLTRRLDESGTHPGADDQTLSDGFLIGPVLPGEGFVDDNDSGSGGVVTLRETASSNDGDLEDIEEPVSDVGPAGAAVNGRIAERPAFDDEAQTKPSFERQRAAGGGSLRAGQRFNALVCEASHI